MSIDPRHILLAAKEGAKARPLWCVRENDGDEVLAGLPASWRAWAAASDFRGRAGELLLLPAEDGAIAGALFGIGKGERPRLADGALARRLPSGPWRFANVEALPDPALATLGWILSAYDFAAYRDAERPPAGLAAPANVDDEEVLRQAEGIFLARNLVNTPAADLGPAELAAHARQTAEAHGAQVRVISGAALKRAFPAVHAVGAGASPERAPRVVEILWGQRDAPRIGIVGKGVVFDSGGLDIKPASAMLLMKKDMGGAAAALAVARMIMAADLNVRLHVVLPLVENAVSAAAMRPGDVVRTRAGLTVEIGNTDAEGRLILADALTRAAEEAPEILIDFATLTGAARVALGPELPALFSDSDRLADELLTAGDDGDDPLWRLPLWRPYAERLKSRVADLCNIATNGQGGAIHAALFLQRFTKGAGEWAHIDLFAWNPTDRPARPKGGDAQAVRAVYAMLKKRHGGARG